MDEWTDDQVVAEMQRRLDRGTVGWHGLLSSEQMDYRGKWWTLSTWIHEQCNNGHFERLADVKAKINELANDGNLNAPVPKAINTTTYGRE